MKERISKIIDYALATILGILGAYIILSILVG